MNGQGYEIDFEALTINADNTAMLAKALRVIERQKRLGLKVADFKILYQPRRTSA
jgi:hypothetical protein